MQSFGVIASSLSGSFRPASRTGSPGQERALSDVRFGAAYAAWSLQFFLLQLSQVSRLGKLAKPKLLHLA